MRHLPQQLRNHCLVVRIPYCGAAVLALVLFLAITLIGCTPGSGLTSLPFGQCKLPDGAQSFGYLFNNEACFATPRTIAITSLVSFNTPPGTVTIFNDDGTSFVLPGVVQPQNFALSLGSALYMLDDSASNQRIASIDLQARKITTQIPLPPGVYVNGAMAFSPDGKLLFVTKSKAELSAGVAPPSLVVVDLTSNKIDGEIALRSTALPQSGIAITPDGKFVYVPVSDSVQGAANSAVYVIDTAARKVAAIISLPNSTLPVHVAATPDGTTVYVALQTSLVAIDVLTNTIAATVAFPAPAALNRIVMDPAGRYIYATNMGPNIAIVDTITNRYVDRIAVAPPASGATSLRISGDGRLLYSVDQGEPFVNLIDTVSRTVLSRTRVTTFPAGQAGWSLFDVVPLQ